MDDKRLNDIKNNIDLVINQISDAAKKTNKTIDDILLVAVTKTFPISDIKSALSKKICHFGENRVQELVEKYDILNEGCFWHFIGRLQTNKVKYIIDKIYMIHSLDRMDLAREIQKRAESKGICVNALVQVNVSGEGTKAGINPCELKSFLKDISYFKNIKVKGLMTIAPYTECSEEVRWVFNNLKNIFIDIKAENIDNIDMEYLSMGMSHDFEVAILEGANIVRIGSSIFGER